MENPVHNLPFYQDDQTEVVVWDLERMEQHWYLDHLLVVVSKIHKDLDYKSN
jgi:hypothetical protein